MNNKTTKIYYTYRDADRITLPARLETWGTREDGIQAVRASFGFGSACKLVSVRNEFTSREEIRREIDATRDTLNSTRIAVLSAKIPAARRLRDDLADRLGHLEQELAGW